MKKRISFLLVLLLAQARAAEEQGAAPVIPLAEPPQSLRDESGAPETDLVDPFQRRMSLDEEDGAAPGFLKTSFGDIPDDFRILSIIVPQNTNTPPMALIKLTAKAEPHLVRPGDLVRIDRDTVMGSAFAGRSRRTPANTSGLSTEAMRTLERYTFYLHVKEIHPTSIEVYHNKKSPDETIILSW